MKNKSYILVVMIFIASSIYFFGNEDSSREKTIEKQPINKSLSKIKSATQIESNNIELVDSSDSTKAQDEKQIVGNIADKESQKNESDAKESVNKPRYNARTDPSLDHDFIKRIDAELKKNAKEGNWTTFEFLADELELKLPKQDYSFALDLAIRFNAPIHVIEGMLAKGGRFNYRHIFSVAKFNRHELYTQLQALGLNVHVTAPDGKNALFPAMANFKDNFVFLLLILDGVNPNIEVKGQRLVDKCLALIVKTQVENETDFKNERYWTAAGHFYRLIRYGNAELLPRHFKLLKQIRVSKPLAFDLMTKELPNKAELLNRLDEHQYVDQES